MPPSYYLKTYPCQDDPNRLLVFSTRKGASVLMDRKTWQALEEGTLTHAEAATLTRLCLLVPDQEAEKKALLSVLEEQNLKNRGLHVIAVLNLDCNFACPYCFEEGVKGSLYMQKETAERLLTFIADRWREGMDTLRIDFYGGEPLLSLSLIESISRQAQIFAEGKKARYFFTLVTNGSLFTGKVAEKLRPLGLLSIKTTLDGPQELHDRSRPFTSGAGSFDTIVKNLKATCDLVKITIGGNFTKDNYTRFPLLFDRLEREGLTSEKVSLVRFDPIINQPPGGALSVEYTAGCCSINEPWLPAAEAFLREEILKRGYKTGKPTPVTCMVEIADAFVVNYDGVIYICPAFIGNKSFAVGDLAGGVGNYRETMCLGLYKNPECAACVYLPLCFGGCRYMTYLREGKIGRIDCKKEYLDASLETLLRQDMTYALRK